MDVRLSCQWWWFAFFVICATEARNHADYPGITISQVTSDLEEIANGDEKLGSAWKEEPFDPWSYRPRIAPSPLNTVSESLPEHHPQRQRYADLSPIAMNGTPDDTSIPYDRSILGSAPSQANRNPADSLPSSSTLVNASLLTDHEDRDHGIRISPLSSPEKKIESIRWYIERKGPDAPVVVLVDTAKASYENIKLLWSFLTNGIEMNASIELFAYNDTTGSSVPLANNLMDTLDRLESTLEASPGLPGGPAFATMIQALETIRSDSSVFLFTGRRAGDEVLGKSAAIELAKKGCEFYAIWSGDYPRREEDVEMYEEIARESSGDFIEFTDRDNGKTLEEMLHRGDKLVDRTGLAGYTETWFDPGNHFAGLRITVVGNLTGAALQSPTGETIALPGLLLSMPSDLIGLTPSPDAKEVRLDARNSPPGRWFLKLQGDENSRYHLRVVALAKREVVDDDSINLYEKVGSPSAHSIVIIGRRFDTNGIIELFITWSRSNGTNASLSDEDRLTTDLAPQDAGNVFGMGNTTTISVEKSIILPRMSYDDFTRPNDDDTDLLYDSENEDDIMKALEPDASKTSEETRAGEENDWETKAIFSEQSKIHQAKRNLRAGLTKIVVPEIATVETAAAPTSSYPSSSNASAADLALIYFGNNDSTNANTQTSTSSKDISDNQSTNHEVIMNMAQIAANQSSRPMNLNAASDLVQLYLSLRRSIASPTDNETNVDLASATQLLEKIDAGSEVLVDSDHRRTSAKIVNSESNLGKEALELEDLGKITTADIARYKTVTVDLSASTNLVARPGTVARLTFEVTNNHALTIRHYFQAMSATYGVAYLQPRDQWIDAGQTVSVLVDIVIPTGASESSVDTVTLHVQAIDSVDKSTYLYVRSSSSTIIDYTQPSISSSFNNNCAGKLASSVCANSQWSTEITVQDSDSGLQRVVSSPTGILAKTGFVSGTKSSVSFYYSSTCCQTTVQVTATDLLGNYRTRTIDVTTWDNLSEGEVAAITLGALFLLVLIVIIVVGIVCCIRRRKSHDLTYTQRYGSRPPAARAERTSF